ncbi:molybdenum cofactor guanylyltransferase [Pedomonas sp. V897]|uniref:molybdenum cofactor guanylyltransferase n=1 Tax=Pedomonas sp. V897 TaxID=3446482 RepID=UPI003EE264F4
MHNSTGRLGAILAGGESRRFGRDKAEARLAGKRLLDHVAGQLAPQVDALVVVGGPARAGYDALPDRPAPGLGPLGGLNAALHEAARRGLAWVLTAPCDAARLPPDLAERLMRGLGAGPAAEGPAAEGPAAEGPAAYAHTASAPAAYAHTDGRDHPTFGLWSTALAPALNAWLAVDRPPRERAIRRWAGSIGAVAVTLPDGCLANINTPEDLAALARTTP